MIVNVTHTRKNMIHPPVVGSYRLDKIFACLPVGREAFLLDHRISLRFSDGLLQIHFFT
jgi:hypothetical protein